MRLSTIGAILTDVFGYVSWAAVQVLGAPIAALIYAGVFVAESFRTR